MATWFWINVPLMVLAFALTTGLSYAMLLSGRRKAQPVPAIAQPTAAKAQPVPAKAQPTAAIVTAATAAPAECQLLRAA